jgi:D-glycero-alpha-D-manno-heptose-7-phosphate kinase
MLSRAPRPGLRVEAPCRADLAGGTLDIWPLGLLHPGAVTVNAALPVRVRLELGLDEARGIVRHRALDGTERRLRSEDAAADLTAAVAFAVLPEAGVSVRVQSQAAVGSGLGGSSAYAVALTRGLLALAGRAADDAWVAALGRDLEARILGVPTGVQDHWPALAGGVLAVHHEPGGERVERLGVDATWISARLTVFDTGIAHHSGMVNWQVIRRRLDGDRGTTVALQAIAEAAAACRSALLARDATGVAAAIAAEWAARRRLAPEVCPPALTALERVAGSAGAQAFKACGAGGGGSVLRWHEPEARAELMRILASAAPAGTVMAVAVTESGCQVLEKACATGLTPGSAASAPA